MLTIKAFTVANWLIILLCLSDTKKIKLIIYFIKSFQKHFLNIFSQIQCADKYKDISASMYVYILQGNILDGEKKTIVPSGKEKWQD